MNDPWDQFSDKPSTGFAAGDPENSSAPSVAAPAQSATPVAAVPSAGADAFAQFKDAAPEAQTPMVGQFGDDQSNAQPLTRLSPDDEAAYRTMLHTADAGTLQSFLEHHGLTVDPKEMQRYVTGRDASLKAGTPVNYDPQYGFAPAPDNGALNAAVLGAGNTLTMGAGAKVAAGLGALQMSLDGKGDGLGDNYNRLLDQNNAQEGADEQNHPWARIAGQLLGGLALPSGLEGVGLKAGTDVLKLGGSMSEARVAAKVAVRNRMAIVGGAYGAAHGAGSADNLSDAATGALTEGALGAVTGGAIGALGKTAKATEALSTVKDAAQDGAGVAVKSATAQDAARIAAQYGIKATPATVGGGAAHAVQMGLGNLPGGMTAVAKGVGAENEGVASAVRGIADNVGTVSTREGAGQAAIAGAQDYSKASRTEGSNLYTQRDNLMGGDAAPVTLDDTKGALADIAAKYPTSQTLAQLMQHPVIRKIAGVAGDAAQPDGVPAELTLGEATDALSHVRGVSRQLAKNGTDPDSITSQVANVKNGLTSDVYRAAAAADQAAGREAGAPGSAVEAQQKADAFWADRKQALGGTLKAPMTAGAKPTEMPAERVFGQIDQDTQIKGGNLARLRDTWFRLPTDARNTIAATKIDDMGRSLPGAQDNTGQAWSFDRYLTNFNKMAPQARNIMFGQDAASQLADIAAYSSRLRDISKSRNFSNTAKHNISGAIMLAVGTALWHGAPMDAVGAAGLIPASYAAASMFLKTPAMRQWTTSALRAATITDPTRSQSAGKALVTRLPAIARAEPAIANEVLALQQKLTGLFSSAPMNVAAASEPPSHVLKTDGQQGNQQTPAQRLQP